MNKLTSLASRISRLASTFALVAALGLGALPAQAEIRAIPTCPDYASISNIVVKTEGGPGGRSKVGAEYSEFGERFHGDSSQVLTNLMLRMVTPETEKGQKGYAQDVFLCGEHVELGLHRNGAFGTKTKPNTGSSKYQVHTWSGQLKTFGMRASMTGWGDKITGTNVHGWVVYMCPRCGNIVNRTEKVKKNIKCQNPDCHHIDMEHGSGPILQNDVNGTLTRDFFTPGTKDEGWLISTGGKFNDKNNLVNATDTARGQQGYNIECNGLNLDKDSTALSAKVYYKGNGGVALPGNTNLTLIAHTELKTTTDKKDRFKITQDVEFQKYDTGFDTWVTISNMTDTVQTNVCYFRGFDPDQPNKWYQGAKNNTDNFYWTDPETHDAYVIASATNSHLSTITSLDYFADRACTPFYYFAPDPQNDPLVTRKYTITPVTMTPGWTTSKAFSTPENGYHRHFDTAMGLRFNIGDMKPGESVRLYYYSSLDPCAWRAYERTRNCVKTSVYVRPQDVANATMTSVAMNTDGTAPTGDWVPVDPEPDGSYRVWSNNLVQVTYKAKEGYVFGDALAESNVVFTATTDPTSVPPELLPVALPLIEIDVKAPDHTTAAVYRNEVDPENLVTDGKVVTNSIAYVVYTINKGDEDWYFRGWTKAVTNTLDTTVNPAVDTNAIPALIEVTCERKVIETDTTIADGVYTAIPSTKTGGAFYVREGTLTATNVTFSDNSALAGGAIYIGENGTVKMNGTFTLVTADDTIESNGTLIWNLADGNKGCLKGYENLVNNGTLQIEIDNDTLAGPANIVLATGDFSNIAGKDTFTITNVSSELSLEMTINGGGVGDKDLAYGLQLVEEEPAGSGKTNLVLASFVPVCSVISEDKTTTNYFETVAAAAAAVENCETIQFLRSVEIDNTLDGHVTAVTIDLNGQFITNKYLQVNSVAWITNSVSGEGGLMNTGTVAVAGYLDLSALQWGKGGLVQSPDGSGKFVVASTATGLSMNGNSPNWMEANAPGCFADCETGAIVYIANQNVTYTKTDSGIWKTDDAVASTKVASTGSYGQGTILYEETYKTVADAFAHVMTNGTVTVLTGCKVDARINIPAEKSVTLDANGQTITIGNGIYAFVMGGSEDANSNGVFTVTGNGTFYADTANSTCFLWARRGNIVVESGSFSMDGSAQCVYANNSNTVAILGGSFVNRTGVDVLNVANDCPVTNIQCYGGSYSKNPATGDDSLGGSFVADGYVSYQTGAKEWTVEKGVLLSNVNIDSTSNTVTVAGYPLDAGKDSYLVPSNQTVTITYIADDDHMFGLGGKEKTITLTADQIGGGYEMTDEDKKSVTDKIAVRWVDGDGGREIALDTRERIVVAAPEEVLAIAYSTNAWGAYPKANWTRIYTNATTTAPFWLSKRGDGYEEWMPQTGAYGKYDFSQKWSYQITTCPEEVQGVTNATIYYSQPYALDWTVDGATLDVTASGLAVEKGGNVLGYDLVKFTATTNMPGYVLSRTGFKVYSNDVETAIQVTKKDDGSYQFEMPNYPVEIRGGYIKGTGATVNGEDLALLSGTGWTYTPGEKLSLYFKSDTTNRFELSGVIPAVGVEANVSYPQPTSATLVLNNVTNDMSSAESGCGLKIYPNIDVTVEVCGTNYFASPAGSSAVVIRGSKQVTFQGNGFLEAVPGKDKTTGALLPGIGMYDMGSGSVLPSLSTCQITGGTYSSTVDPSLVPWSKAGFDNGDGTWTVKNAGVVTYSITKPFATSYVTTNALDEPIPVPDVPKADGFVFMGWQDVTGGQGQFWEFDKPLKKANQVLETVFEAIGTTPTMAEVIPEGQTEPVVVDSLEKALYLAPAGGEIVVSNSNETVTNDRPVIVQIGGASTPTITVPEDSNLSVKTVGNTVYIGEVTNGVVVIENEAGTDDPAEVGVRVQNACDIVDPAIIDAATKMAEVKSADALVASVKVNVTPKGGDENSKIVDITPVLTLKTLTNGVEKATILVSTNDFALSGEPMTVTVPCGEIRPVAVLHSHEGELTVYRSATVEEGGFTYDAVGKTVSIVLTEFSEITVLGAETTEYLNDSQSGSKAAGAFVVGHDVDVTVKNEMSLTATKSIQFEGTTTLEGPLTLNVDHAGAITNSGTLVWTVDGANTNAWLNNFDQIVQTSDAAFKIKTSYEQTYGTYVLADHATNAIGKEFKLVDETGDEFDNFTVPQTRYDGPKAYKLSVNGKDQLVYSVGPAEPHELYFEQEPTGGKVQAYTNDTEDLPIVEIFSGEKVIPDAKVTLKFTPESSKWQIDQSSLMLVDATATTNDLASSFESATFRMPVTNATLYASFMISDDYRAELLAKAATNYDATTNLIDDLRAVFYAANGGLLSDEDAANFLEGATKSYVETTNTLASADKVKGTYTPMQGEATSAAFAHNMETLREDAKALSDSKLHGGNGYLYNVKYTLKTVAPKSYTCGKSSCTICETTDAGTGYYYENGTVRLEGLIVFCTPCKRLGEGYSGARACIWDAGNKVELLVDPSWKTAEQIDDVDFAARETNPGSDLYYIYSHFDNVVYGKSSTKVAVDSGIRFGFEDTAVQAGVATNAFFGYNLRATGYGSYAWKSGEGYIKSVSGNVAGSIPAFTGWDKTRSVYWSANVVENICEGAAVYCGDKWNVADPEAQDGTVSVPAYGTWSMKYNASATKKSLYKSLPSWMLK